MTCLKSLAVWSATLLIVFQAALDCRAQTSTAKALSRMEPRNIERIEKYRSSPSADKYLKLVGTTDKVLEAMRGLENVESLSLICVCGFTDDGVRHLATVRGIRKLVMGSPNSIFTGSGLLQMKEMPLLESLTLIGPVTDLRGLRNFPNLRSLDVRRCTLDDTALESLSGVPHLEVLRIERSPKITDAGIAHVARLKDLRDLQLLGTSIGDDGVSHLTRLSRLEHLSLSSKHMTGAGLESLGRLTRLQSLLVNFSGGDFSDDRKQCLKGLDRLTVLSLRGVYMTPEQIRCIGRLPRLRNLSLTDRDVTDESLVVLSHIPNLERLTLGSVSVTAAGLKHLEEAVNLKYVRFNYPEYLQREDLAPLKRVLWERHQDEGVVGFLQHR